MWQVTVLRAAVVIAAVLFAGVARAESCADLTGAPQFETPRTLDEAKQQIEQFRAVLAIRENCIRQLAIAIDLLNNKIEQAQSDGSASNVAVNSADLLDAKYREAFAAYYAYQEQMMNVSERLFRWQQRASEISMWVVFCVVAAGVAFSGVQLWASVSKGGPQPKSKLELSAQRFRIQTSVVGLVVLIISLAFFYLFLVKVYEINVLAPPTAADMSKTARPVSVDAAMPTRASPGSNGN
jgi:hypothetical protein